jgi:hypothetical protein
LDIMSKDCGLYVTPKYDETGRTAGIFLPEL